MKSNKNHKANPFKLFYDNELPAEMKEGFISLVAQSCEITYNHFYYWLKHPESIKLNDRKKIAQIAGKPVHELFIEKTKLQMWWHSISPSKKSMIIEIVCKKLGIDQNNFYRYISQITKKAEFNELMADYSKIKIEQLHEPSEY